MFFLQHCPLFFTNIIPCVYHEAGVTVFTMKLMLVSSQKTLSMFVRLELWHSVINMRSVDNGVLQLPQISWLKPRNYRFYNPKIYNSLPENKLKLRKLQLVYGYITLYILTMSVHRFIRDAIVVIAVIPFL